MKRINSTASHQDHDKGTSNNPWNKQDFEDGSVDRHFAEQKRLKAERENRFEAGLSEDGSMSRIAKTGTIAEKAKAFDYMAKNTHNTPTDAPTQTTPTQIRPSHIKTRVPFKSKLIQNKD